MRILLAEDSPVYRHLMSQYLKEWGFDPVIAKDGEEAWRLLEGTDAPTLILLNWMLPGVDGIELCRRIRHLEANELYAYTVVLTAKARKEDLLEAMEAGADDYLVKPFEPSELRARLLTGKRILDLQRELISSRESLRFAATHDFLTGILNRAEVLASLERQLARSRRGNRPVGILLADLDHFKRINDSLGHLAGDVVLKEVAGRLRSYLRVYDSVGRYGGEEFLLILPDCDLDTALRRANEMCRSVSSESIATLGGSTSVTLSMGATSSDCFPDETIETLLQETDTALYRAKENGRNCAQASTLGSSAALAIAGSLASRGSRKCFGGRQGLNHRTEAVLR
jgi:two-component system cell cycle response regulator